MCGFAALLSVVASFCLSGAGGPGLESFFTKPIVDRQRIKDEVVRFVLKRVAPFVPPSTREAWNQEARRLREVVLRDVVYRGVPQSWLDHKVKVTFVGRPLEGPAYRIRKLRYEAVPGLWIPALLYEPSPLRGRVPAVLNVNGHDPRGKAAPYKQIRCINQAKRGMLALNVEWLGMGQLRGPGFRHGCANQLELLGVSGLSPFYLVMERALDVLLSLPHADPERIAVAGLSGGGWQTIFLSSLDTRVVLANPVAGYSATPTRTFYVSDLGDSEQAPTDFACYADYTHLTALRAPRPTLLTYNAKDNCCFAASHALGPLLEAAQPVFSLLGEPRNLRWHVNHDPGTHNFERLNREAFLRVLKDFFFPGDDSFSTREIPCEKEIRTEKDLTVPLPEDNLDFNKLAFGLLAERRTSGLLLPAGRWERRAAKQAARELLAEIVRFRRYSVRKVSRRTVNVPQGRLSLLRLELDDGWTLPAVMLEPERPKGTVVLLSDNGMAKLADRAAEIASEGLRVVATDPLFFGSCALRPNARWALLVQSVGGRPLGIQAAQVAALCSYLMKEHTAGKVQLRGLGPRAAVVALVAGALSRNCVSAVLTEDSFSSLSELITRNWIVQQAPELFCFGLLRSFDIPDLRQLCR